MGVDIAGSCGVGSLAVATILSICEASCAGGGDTDVFGAKSHVWYLFWKQAAPAGGGSATAGYLLGRFGKRPYLGSSG